MLLALPQALPCPVGCLRVGIFTSKPINFWHGELWGKSRYEGLCFRGGIRGSLGRIGFRV